jgi:cell division protein FtsB
MRLVFRFAPVLFFFMLLLWMGVSLLGGRQGLFQLSRMEAKVAALEAQKATLEAERVQLAARVARLKADGLDLDYADERARALLGYARADEIIVPLRDGELAELQ